MMLRPEGDMLPAYEKKRPSAWADPQKRAEMLAQKRAKGGKKGKKRRKGKRAAVKQAAGSIRKGWVKREI